MKPGIELDEVIAEKLMGLKKLKRRRQSGSHGGLVNAWVGADDVEVPSLSKYSTYIAAAWNVAQEIKDLDRDNQFVIHISDSKHKECTVEVRFYDDERNTLCGPFFISGESAPHAICLAALKVMGG